MQYIIHLSDLHIGSWGKQVSRGAEYKQIFDKLHNLINSYNNAIICITGDTFHLKTSYSGEDVSLFKYLLDGLRKYKVIIIAGNHDTNLRNSDSIDLITPLVGEYTNVIYKINTEVFDICGVKFHHIAMNTENPAIIPDAIMLYHGFVNGAVFGKHTVADSNISRETIAGHRLTLLGDIHEHQFITDTVAYAGSLIQQNLAESRNKGVVIWDLLKNRGQFITISNDTELIRLDLRGKTDEECAEIVANTTKPANLLKLSLISDAEDTRDIVAIVEAKFGKVNTINRTANIELNPNKDILETLNGMLSDLPQSSRDEILQMHEKTLTTTVRGRWSILRLEWNNIMKYGAETSVIDFTKFDGILSGVVGNNMMGKSTIIDIIMCVLYNSLTRNVRATYIHYGENLAYTKITIEVNGVIYTISRVDYKILSKSYKVDFMRLDGDTFVNACPSATSISEVYIAIKDLIGTKEQFTSTSLYSADSEDIFKHNTVNRIKTISSLFGMPDYEATINNLNGEKKKLECKLNSLLKPRNNDNLLLDSTTEELAVAEKSHNELVLKRDVLTTELNALSAKYVRPIATINTEISNIMSVIEASNTFIIDINNDIEITVDFAPKIVISADERKLAETTIQSADVIEEQLRELIIQRDGLSSVKPKCRYVLRDITQINAEINNNKYKFNDNCACCADNRILLTDNTRLVELRAMMQDEIDNSAQALLEYNQYNAISLKIDALRASLVKITRVNDAIAKVGAHYRYEQYTLANKVVELRAKLLLDNRKFNLLTEELTVAQSINTASITLYRTKIAQLDKIIVEILKKIGTLRSEVKYLTADNLIRCEYETQSTILIPRIEMFKTYMKCLKNHELKLNTIAKSMRSIIIATNDILRDIVEFTIDFEIVGQDFNIMVIEPNGFCSTVRASSGFQQVIISLCMRLALTSLLGSTANFMILDEPIHYVNKHYVGKIQELLLMLPSLYKFVFIISNVPELTDLIDNPLSISVINGDSHISNSIAEKRVENKSAKLVNVKSARVNDVSDITCDICNITIKKLSYNAHLKSKAHLSKKIVI
jgi:DNA repair exonuclease SbcCD nuclease subunit